MPRIRCHYLDCIFLAEGYCGASSVEIDPEEGCLTFSRVDDLSETDEWQDDTVGDLWEDEEEELYAEDDELDMGDGDWLEEEID